jgi:hypothetical protein
MTGYAVRFPVRRILSTVLLYTIPDLRDSCRWSLSDVAAHAGNAAFAAPTAWFNCSAEACRHAAKASSVAGLITVMVSSPATILPSMSRLNFHGDP